MEDVRQSLFSVIRQYKGFTEKGYQDAVQCAIDLYMNILEVTGKDFEELAFVPVAKNRTVSILYKGETVDATFQGGLYLADVFNQAASHAWGTDFTTEDGSEKFSEYLMNHFLLRMVGHLRDSVDYGKIESETFPVEKSDQKSGYHSEYRYGANNKPYVSAIVQDLVLDMDVPGIQEKLQRFLLDSIDGFGVKFEALKKKGYKSRAEKAKNQREKDWERDLESYLEVLVKHKVSVELLREFFCRTGILKCQHPPTNDPIPPSEIPRISQLVNGILEKGTCGMEVEDLLNSYQLKLIMGQ